MRKRYTAAFKAQVVQEILKEDKTIVQLASEYSVHPSQLNTWKTMALNGLPSLFSREHKADVCNRPVLAATVPEAVSVGAALLTGLAIGLFKDEAQAAATVACDFCRFEPDAERAKQYDQWYNDVYVKMYAVLKQLREPC